MVQPGRPIKPFEQLRIGLTMLGYRVGQTFKPKYHGNERQVTVASKNRRGVIDSFGFGEQE